MLFNPGINKDNALIPIKHKIQVIIAPPLLLKNCAINDANKAKTTAGTRSMKYANAICGIVKLDFPSKSILESVDTINTTSKFIIIYSYGDVFRNKNF